MPLRGTVCRPDQEHRYRIRGGEAVARGDYSAFEVVLCSPEAYSVALRAAARFDRFVSYEAISAFLRSRENPVRSAYRASFVATAATRGANSWTPTKDEQTDVFWRKAYGTAVREFPVLEMNVPDPTNGNTWAYFKPQDLPTRPQHIYVQLKGDRGFADLTFGGSSVYKLEPRVASLLDADMTVHQVGGSAAIRLTTSAFQVSDDWEASANLVRTAFAACGRLISFYRLHQQTLVSAGLASRSER
jgi:hypothetical protein